MVPFRCRLAGFRLDCAASAIVNANKSNFLMVSCSQICMIMQIRFRFASNVQRVNAKLCEVAAGFGVGHRQSIPEQRGLRRRFSVQAVIEATAASITMLRNLLVISSSGIVLFSKEFIRGVAKVTFARCLILDLHTKMPVR